MRKRILLIVLIPVTLLLVDSVIEFRDVAYEGEHGEMKIVEAFALETKSLIAIEFYERYRDMKGLALNKGLLGERSEVEGLLNSYVQLFKDYDLITLLDLEGNPLAVNSVTSSGDPVKTELVYGRNYSKEDWFHKTKNKKFSEDPKKGIVGVYFQDAHIEPKLTRINGGKEHLVNSFTTLVKDMEGNPFAILHGIVNISWLEQELLHVYENMKEEGLSTAHISVFNSNDVLISDLDGHKKAEGDGLFNRDMESEILKRPLSTFGESFVKLSSAKKHAVEEITNEKKDLDQIVAYASFKDKKALDAVGWKFFVKADKEELMHNLLAAERRFIIGLTAVVLISIIFALMVANVFNRSLTGTVSTLVGASESLNSSVSRLNVSTSQLENAVGEQSSASEKTSAAITEINSMSERNVEMVSGAQRLGEECLKASEEANAGTDQLKGNMDLVKKSNDEMERGVEATLSEMTGLVEAVSEISEKTKLINEIVFQTKLLSFNASVEAARAGEHGRGFSVVAEEMGLLASNSGAAAGEIFQIVEKSLERVSSAVEKSRDNLQQNLAQSNQAVQKSFDSAIQVDELLTLISKKINELDTAIASVESASKEQQLGVKDVDSALAQISSGNSEIQHGTTSNRKLVGQFIELVGHLSKEAGTMKTLMEGSKAAHKTATVESSSQSFEVDEDERQAS